MTRYRLVSGDTTVDVTESKDGGTWQAEIRIDRRSVKYRRFDVLDGRRDRGILIAARHLRREFGVTGIYQPI